MFSLVFFFFGQYNSRQYGIKTVCHHHLRKGDAIWFKDNESQ